MECVKTLLSLLAADLFEKAYRNLFSLSHTQTHARARQKLISKQKTCLILILEEEKSKIIRKQLHMLAISVIQERRTTLVGKIFSVLGAGDFKICPCPVKLAIVLCSSSDMSCRNLRYLRGLLSSTGHIVLCSSSDMSSRKLHI
jgi:hypothetical protein